MTYKYLPDRPDRPTPDFLRDRYDALRARIDEAESAETDRAWLDLFDDWNALKAYVGSEGPRRRLRHDADARDEEAEAAFTEFRRELKPVAEAGDEALGAALLDSRHAEAVGAARGEMLLAKLALARQTLDPRNADLRVEEGDVVQEYDRLVSTASVQVDGRELTIPRARALEKSADPARRREAFFAWRGWYRDHRDELHDIYGRLVSIRDRMGRNLGHDSFVPLGHARMRRTDYGPEGSATFRGACLEHAAPVHARSSARQARSLGTERLAPWDAPFDPEAVMPSDACEPVATQPERVQGAFDALSPKLGEHFRAMRERSLIDLENRPGKRPGAYCTQLPDEDAVAIFCNSVGSADDIRTLVHESGHAFQGWESRWIEAVDLRSPTADAAEVHSMGMELLVQRHLDRVLDRDVLPAYCREGWRRALNVLGYASAIDGFQHWVYENPSATPRERDAEWVRLARSFQPGVDWDGHEDLLAARWLAQLHLFHFPFYYLDYAIAQCGALELGLLDERDHGAAMDAYHELCRLGGTKGVLELFSTAGLRSPLEPATVESLSAFLAERLGVAA